MTRRLLLAVAALRLAALPLSLDPATVELGSPVTVRIELPDDETELSGFPDLGDLALLAPPQQTGTHLSFQLLPLRPGRLSLPPLALRHGQQWLSTAAAELEVTAPELPAQPQPLRPLPPADRKALDSSPLPLLLPLAGLLLLILLIIWRRRPKVESPPTGIDAVLTALADDVRQHMLPDDPDWHALRRRLDRLRFAPLPCSEQQLQELRDDFAKLQEERT